MDFISALPDHIMSQIMGCLPLRDAARMGVLSRKWRSTWLSLPQLTFDAEFFKDVLKDKQSNTCEIYCILSTILLSHVGPISKFYLHVPQLKSVARCFIAPCISFLSRNNVKEITIYNGDRRPLTVNCHVFSCLELEILKLTNCIFKLPPSFKGFRNLMSLELEKTKFLKNSFRDMIASCPKLESLTLKNWTGFECIDITAPKLRYLTVSGKFESVSIQDSLELIAISISLEEMVENDHSTTLREFISWLSKLKRLEKLCFRGFFCKFLAAGEILGILPTEYKCVKVLELSNIEFNDLDAFRCLVGLIQSCPNVEELNITFSSHSADHDLDCYTFNHSLSHLRIVRVTSVMGISLELKLVKFLLLCSPALEELYVEPIVNFSTYLESRMTRQLMRFRRASAKAEIIYLDRT